MVIRFPGALLKEQSISWQLVRRSTTPPGQTGGGFIPMAETTGGGLWRAELGSIPLRTKEQVLAWRAIEAALDGGASQVVVPMCDKRHFPAPIIGGVPVYSTPPVVHDDGASFDDGAGYHQSVVLAQALESVGLRSTRLTIRVTFGADPQAGQYFSVSHPNMLDRLYMIATSRINADGDSEVTIRPPLREDVIAGTLLNFDFPSCVMQVASPEELNLTLEMRKWGKPTAQFVESFDPSMLNGTKRANVRPIVTPVPADAVLDQNSQPLLDESNLNIRE